MDGKRYQVFLSSTYADLKDERKLVAQALRDCDCFVEEMEDFPPTDQDQMDFIRSVIDPCDYYVLIIRNRYGSMDDKGISFTEKEYDYAVSKKIPTIALIYNGSDDADGLVDTDKKLKRKLERFRTKVMKGRMVKNWSTETELISGVFKGINLVKKTHPSPGWVRGNLPASAEVLNEINELRKENESLKSQIAKSKTIQDELNLVEITEDYEIPYYKMSSKTNSGRLNHLVIPWLDLFIHLGIDFKRGIALDGLHRKLEDLLPTPKSDFYYHFNEDDLETICFQFSAYGLIKMSSNLYCSITAKGEKLLLGERTIKKLGPQ